MSDELHLVERVVDAHRFGGMVLDADHLSGFVVVGLLDDGGRLSGLNACSASSTGDRGGGPCRGNRGLVAVVDLAAVLAAPQPVLSLWTAASKAP